VGSELKSLADAWRVFRGKRGPQLIAFAIAAALVARVAVGDPSWRDAVAAGFLIVVYPFGEWAIHVHLLHSRVPIATTRAHREHHEEPGRLDLINFTPLEGLAILGLAVPVAVAPVALVLGLAPALSALLTGYVLVGIYEWTHFLIHTAYRPRSRAYRSVWRNHRLHHFKNERYWHGITNTISDRVLGTNPDQTTVPRSRTARTLS
jgi:hypothetical protein